MEKREEKKDAAKEVNKTIKEVNKTTKEVNKTTTETQSKSSRWKTILWTALIVSFLFIFILPFLGSFFLDYEEGNVAIIPLNGVITADGESYLGQETVTSQDVIELLEKAEQNSQIKAIIVEINSPGGSPVASDEIGSVIKKIKKEKPVVAVIRDVGASGGYWIASASNYIIANRMSVTGSIGVTSAYLEFSGLMEKYGVSYERLIAGKYKDLGTPFKKLDQPEKELLQKKLDLLQNYFIHEISQNRKLEENKVKTLATGEFFLGGEALELGLIDELGDTATAQEYLQKTEQIKELKIIRYETEISFLKLLTKVWTDFPVKIGQGIGSILVEQENKVMLI